VVSEEMLFKEIVDARTHGRWTTDNGPSQKLTLSTLCSGELKKLNTFLPKIFQASAKQI